ncbi:MAG: MBOAT family protein, partial [Treponema sp.]|nr:MBOAT family protein [Treponema sp.]
MVFSSAVFLFLFLPVTLLVYYTITPSRLKNAFLLLASLFFYSWGEPLNVFLMIGAILLNYACALLMHAFREKKRLQNLAFLTALFGTVGLLFYFKYSDFAITNCNALFHTDFPLQNRALPIGISFFTFQILSYLIEVKRETVPVQKNPLNLGLYISFFPQLIAGPIVRYHDVNEQLQKRAATVSSFSRAYSRAYSRGCIRFMTGFSKKLLIADQLAPYVDDIFAKHGCSAPVAWLGIIAYTLQIYFDFSGYSDMAIGLGKLFGFDFPENFNYPYIAASIKDFWKRWHISLSQWFRDYVYIPLGGNRGSRARVLLNLCLVWALTGFWHGASWNFIVWGLYYC